MKFFIVLFVLFLLLTFLMFISDSYFDVIDNNPKCLLARDVILCNELSK